MEWEIMFMCNLLGVSLLILIALFHIVGNAPEKNGDIITFVEKEDWTN